MAIGRSVIAASKIVRFFTAENAEIAEKDPYSILIGYNIEIAKLNDIVNILVPPLCGGTRVFDALRRAGSYPQVQQLTDWTQSVPSVRSPAEWGNEGDHFIIHIPVRFNSSASRIQYPCLG